MQISLVLCTEFKQCSTLAPSNSALDLPIDKAFKTFASINSAIKVLESVTNVSLFSVEAFS